MGSGNYLSTSKQAGKGVGDPKAWDGHEEHAVDLKELLFSLRSGFIKV